MFIGTVIECIAHLSSLKEGIFEIKEHKPKRSLSQNAFYWQCTEQVAKAIMQPKAYVHNLLLRRCEIYETIGIQPILVVLPDTDSAEMWALYSEDYHFKPTLDFDKKNGLRWYRVLKGSKDFTVEEMNLLIEQVLSEIEVNHLELPLDKATQRALEEYEKIKERRQQI